jgi:hypothetical protein
VLVSQDLGGAHVFNGAAQHGVTSYLATVGSGGTPGIAVTAATPIDTGAGFATIKPAGAGLLTELLFSPADASAFDSFTFRRVSLAPTAQERIALPGVVTGDRVSRSSPNGCHKGAPLGSIG